MKQQFTEAFVGSKRYRLNTKRTGIDVDEGTGKKTKWVNYVQCKNSPELEAEWKKLTAQVKTAGGQAPGGEPGRGKEAGGARELLDGWRLDPEEDLSADSQPDDGECVGTLTAPDGRRFLAVNRNPRKGCVVCAFFNRIDSNGCPRTDAGVLACCADPFSSLGDVTFSADPDETSGREEDGGKEEGGAPHAPPEGLPERPDPGPAEDCAKFPVPVPFRAPTDYSATVHILWPRHGDAWYGVATGELRGAQPECGRFGQDELSDPSGATPAKTPLLAMRKGLRRIMDDIADRLCKPVGAQHSKNLNDAFGTLEDLVSSDTAVAALLSRHGLCECGPVAAAAPGPSRLLPEPEEAVMLVDIGRIVDSPYQIRSIDPESDDIRELAESIKAGGLIHPLAVRPIGNGNYELVAGHRRRAACRLLGLAQVRCIANPLTDTQAEAALVTENLQRKNLTPLEEADSVARLIGRGKTPEEVAAMLGVSEKFIYRRRAMARITPEWRAFVTEIKAGPEFIETAGRLPSAVAGKVLKAAREDWTAKKGDANALRNLVARLEQRVDGSPWAKRHPDWCSDCPKRTDASDACPDLFDAAPGKAADEAAKCLDPECWRKSTSKFIVEQKTELKHAHGELLTANHWSAYNFAAAKSKKNCVPVLITDGSSAGEVRWAPKPEHKPEEQAFQTTEEHLRKAAHYEAVNGSIKELRYGKKHRGAAAFRPGLSLVVRLAIAYGAQQEDKEERDCYSPAERVEKSHAEKTQEQLAAELWERVAEEIVSWRDAEEIVRSMIRCRDDGELALAYSEAAALERLLGLDEAFLEKTRLAIYGKLNAKFGAKKGAGK